jgi:hypothetical protein
MSPSCTPRSPPPTPSANEPSPKALGTPAGRSSPRPRPPPPAPTPTCSTMPPSTACPATGAAPTTPSRRRTASQQVDRVLDEVFGPRAHEVLAAYSASMPGAGDREVRRAVMTDERYAVPTRRVLDAQSRHARVWSYRFDAPSPRPSAGAVGPAWCRRPAGLGRRTRRGY